MKRRIARESRISSQLKWASFEGFESSTTLLRILQVVRKDDDVENDERVFGDIWRASVRHNSSCLQAHGRDPGDWYLADFEGSKTKARCIWPS